MWGFWAYFGLCGLSVRKSGWAKGASDEGGLGFTVLGF